MTDDDESTVRMGEHEKALPFAVLGSRAEKCKRWPRAGAHSTRLWQRLWPRLWHHHEEAHESAGQRSGGADFGGEPGCGGGGSAGHFGIEHRGAFLPGLQFRGELRDDLNGGVGEAVPLPCEGEEAIGGGGYGKTGNTAVEGVPVENPLGDVRDAVAVRAMAPRT